MAQDGLGDGEVERILRDTRRVALVGASNRPERPSHGVMRFLLARGYQVTPVNPGLAGQVLLGQAVVASLAEAGPLDMVDIFRASDQAGAVVDDAIRLGARTVWLQLGVIDVAAAERGRAAGLSVVMDRCPAIEMPRLRTSTGRRLEPPVEPGHVGPGTKPASPRNLLQGDPMTNEERDLISQFVARVGGNASGGFSRSVPSTQPSLPPIDPEADRFIADQFASHPEARYRVTQMAVVQEAALAEAASRMQRMQAELEPPAADAADATGRAPAGAVPGLPGRPVRRRPVGRSRAATVAGMEPGQPERRRNMRPRRHPTRSRNTRPTCSPVCSSGRAAGSSAPPWAPRPAWPAAWSRATC